MKLWKSKSKLSTIALILLLTISAILVALPVSIAQEPKRVNPYPYINAMPNPVTVNTPTLFHVGSIYPHPPPAALGWTGLTVEITTPGGQTEILGPIKTDTTGGTGVPYTPTMVGTYTVRTHFPEQTLTAYSGYIGPAGTIMEEAYSEPLELIVQEEPLEYYPGHPLPEEYWTRPIDGQIREWYTIAGNFMEYVPPTNPDPPTIVRPYNEYAPESAHILWTESLTMGGLAGGITGEHGFEQGDAYVGKFGGGGLFGSAGPVIIGGVLFYNQFESNGGDDVEQWVNAVDLHTGEMLWSKPLTTPDGAVLRLTFGQVFYWDSYNYHGVFDFLWATESLGWGQPTNWHAFDPFSGRWVYTMENMPGGTRVRGEKGEIYLYDVDKNDGTMTLWNSSRVVSDMGSFDPQGRVYDAEDVADGIEWTVNITGLSDLPGRVYKVRREVILGSDFQRGGPAPNPASMWAISVDLAQGDAELMWDIEWPLPLAMALMSVEDVSVEDDLILVAIKETRARYGFRLSTGAQIWGPTESTHYTDVWGHSSGNSWDIIADGKVIAGNYGGTVWCWDAQNGSVLWKFDIEDPYTEVLHNIRWRFRPVIVADGKLYIENTEHNPRDPQPRGAPFICLDLESGEEIWRLPYRAGEWSTTGVIADSIIVVQSTYDQRIYAVGKGPSATTVSIQNDVIAHGSSVLVKGMVTDVSPGTQDPKLALRFPNGVPAVSDASMNEWMTYVYNQFARPADAVGVQVKLEAYDPNGNYQDLGTTTSDSYGRFGFVFEPEIPGPYWISATFEGSNGYYGSQSTTYLQVGPAPDPYPTDPGYQGPTANEVAQKVIDQLSDSPTADDIAQAVLNQLPAYPDVPSAAEVAQETISQLPETPAYLTIDLVIIAAVAIVLIIGLYSIVKKQK